jgi:CRISPR system Cascade subunit CasC
MHVLELHKIQSYPVSCLNRDDAGSPKTAIFGGVQRSRISSQCEKRAMREYWKSAGLTQFAGIRTKFIRADFERALAAQGLDEDRAKELTQTIMETLGKIDAKRPHKLTTLIFISPGEMDRVATAAAACQSEKEAIKAVKAAMKGALPKDATDIALYGRMFADETEFSSDACCMVSHALSTHKTATELDFFTAMDENKPASYEDEEHDEGQGAGMMDSAEFTSATFYHYCALNLDALTAKLPNNTPEEIKAIVRVFVEAFAIAMPGARRTSHNAHTRPAFVLATVQTGQPMQLVNAFEAPIRANGHGYEQSSIDRLIEHRDKQKLTWGISYDLEVSTPTVPFQELLNEVVSHV